MSSSNQIFSSPGVKYIGGNFPEFALSRATAFPLASGGEGLLYLWGNVDILEIPESCITAAGGIFTIKKACSLLIKAQMVYAGAAAINATFFYETGIQINNDLTRDFFNQKAAILTPTLSLHTVIHNLVYYHEFSTGDTFSVRVFQNSAATVNLLGNDNALNPFTQISIIQME